MDPEKSNDIAKILELGILTLKDLRGSNSLPFRLNFEKLDTAPEARQSVLSLVLSSAAIRSGQYNHLSARLRAMRFFPGLVADRLSLPLALLEPLEAKPGAPFMVYGTLPHNTKSVLLIDQLVDVVDLERARNSLESRGVQVVKSVVLFDCTRGSVAPGLESIFDMRQVLRELMLQPILYNISAILASEAFRAHVHP